MPAKSIIPSKVVCVECSAKFIFKLDVPPSGLVTFTTPVNVKSDVPSPLA